MGECVGGTGVGESVIARVGDGVGEVEGVGVGETVTMVAARDKRNELPFFSVLASMTSP